MKILLYKFPVYTIIIQYLYTLQRNNHHQSSFYPLPHSWLLSPILPTLNPQFVYNYLYFFIALHNIGLYHPSPVRSAAGWCFCFGSISSFFLELFLHFFSSSILGTYPPVEFIFQCLIFLPFHTVHGVLKAGILKWFAIPFSSGLLWWRQFQGVTKESDIN